MDHTVSNLGRLELTASNAAQLARSGEKLTYLFFIADSPFYIADPGARKWYLHYLQKLIPPSKAGPLTALHGFIDACITAMTSWEKRNFLRIVMRALLSTES